MDGRKLKVVDFAPVFPKSSTGIQFFPPSIEYSTCETPELSVATPEITGAVSYGSEKIVLIEIPGEVVSLIVLVVVAVTVTVDVVVVPAVAVVKVLSVSWAVSLSAFTLVTRK